MSLFPTAWLDGRIVPTKSLPIQPPWEPWGFKGVGVFTTTRTFLKHDCLAFWPKHLARLSSTMQEVGVAWSSQRRGHVEGADMPALTLGNATPEKAIVDWAKSLDAGNVCVRVNIVEGLEPWVVARPLPETPVPTELAFSSEPVTPDRRLKLVAQEWRRTAMEEANAKGVWDVVARSNSGRIFDASRANIVVRRLTDRPASWVLADPPGMLRGVVADALMESDLIRPFPVGDSLFQKEFNMVLSEVVATNSVRGVVPIHRVEGRLFTPTDETRKLQAWFEKAATAHAI